MYRQGDILIERIETIPASAKRRRQRKRIVIAEGESSGHAHVVDTAVPFDDAGITYLDIQQAVAMLTHQEHATIELPRGKYRVIRQREYAPEAPRQVAD
mgnify:FL=1